MPKGVDPLPSGTPQFQARQRRWRHNSFSGHVAMARRGMYAIINSDSVTPVAKRAAEAALSHLDCLAVLIKKRID